MSRRKAGSVQDRGRAWPIPDNLLSSHRHVRNAGLVVSSLPRACTKVKRRVGGRDNAETCVAERVYKPYQISISKGLNAGFVFFPVENACNLSRKLRRRRLEAIELLQGIERGHGGSFEGITSGYLIIYPLYWICRDCLGASMRNAHGRGRRI